MRIGYLVSHPIQYYAPIFRALAARCDLTVFFAHRQTAEQQARAGFGVAFDWDVDLLSGYESRFLENRARSPSTDAFWGIENPELAELVPRGGFDAFVVPGWALRSYWQATLACRKAGVPVLVRGDSQLVGRRATWLRAAKSLVFSRMLSAFDGFLYVGQRNREYLEHYGVAERDLFFAPHCVDDAAFRRASAEARANEPPSTGVRRRRILYAGKLLASKGPLDVLRAVLALHERGLPVELVCAGAGELAPVLAHLARRAGLPAEFLGFVNQSRMPTVYASADVVVLPSVETWGLVVNEAMACGVPAVVSDAVGCGPDLVVPGLTGATFPLGDTDALAQAIAEVLAFDPAATSRHVAERIARYSPEKTAEGVLEAAEALRRRR